MVSNFKYIIRPCNGGYIHIVYWKWAKSIWEVNEWSKENTLKPDNLKTKIKNIFSPSVGTNWMSHTTDVHEVGLSGSHSSWIASANSNSAEVSSIETAKTAMNSEA